MRIDFQTLDGAVVGVEDIVPFTYSMVVDRQEYRFSVVAGERRFVEITAQACALPGASGRTAPVPTRPVPTKPAPQDAAPLGTAPPHSFPRRPAGPSAPRPRSPSAIW